MRLKTSIADYMMETATGFDAGSLLFFDNSPNGAGAYVLKISGNAVHGRDGTATLPGYTFIEDTDTGIFRAGTNSLGFSTGGVEGIRLDSSGNVGIGTTSRMSKLYARNSFTVTGLVPSGVTGAIVSDNYQTLGAGSGTIYGLVGAARAVGDASGDKAYGGYFSVSAQNRQDTQVGIHVLTTSAGAANVAEFYQGSNPIAVIGADGMTDLGSTSGTVGRLNIAGSADTSTNTLLQFNKGAFGTSEFTQFYTSGSNYGLGLNSLLYVNKGSGNAALGKRHQGQS